MDILSITNLRKSFGDKDILKGLNLSVPEHSIFGFVGRNGAGKTTTMKAILGLLNPNDGEITVCGQKVVYGQTSTNRYIGYLPDVPEFYSFMTPREYLQLCGESLGMSDSEIKNRTEELLNLVGLSDEKHHIKGFSRGMKQRLGIAQALIGSPKLLICDEPTSALDPIGRKEILDILLSVREETTVLFSTHILSDVERICTHIALLNDGEIAMEGTAGELKNTHYTREFIVQMDDDLSSSTSANISPYVSNSATADSHSTNPHINKLLSNFHNARYEASSTIIFSGDEKAMFEVMSFIIKEQIPISKLERMEPSLEGLFMEVVGK